MKRIANIPITMKRIADFPINMKRIANFPITMKRIANLPINMKRIANFPITMKRIANLPINMKRIANFPINMQRIANIPINMKRMTNFPTRLDPHLAQGMGCAGSRCQVRSRTAGVSNWSELLIDLGRHRLSTIWMIKKSKKMRLLKGPGKSFLSSQNSVFFGTLKIDWNFCRKNRTFHQTHEASVIFPFFRTYRRTYERRTDGH